MGDIFINIILSLITGLISGIIVTLYYRNKDAQRETVKYLYDLREYVYKLNIDIMPLNLIYPEQIEEAHEKLKKEGFLKEPIRYNWYKFNKEEKIVLEEFEKIKNNILDNYLKIIDCQFRIKDRDLQSNDIKKILDKQSKAHEELCKYWQILNIDFIKRIDELIKSCTKIK